MRVLGKQDDLLGDLADKYDFKSSRLAAHEI